LALKNLFGESFVYICFLNIYFEGNFSRFCFIFTWFAFSSS